MTDPIARSRRLGIVLTLLLISIGCSQSSALDPADLMFVLITVGDELDPDGYTIVIDSAPGVAVPINGEAEVPGLSANSHSFEILGIAPNCRLTNAITPGVLDTRNSTTVELIVLCLQADPGRIVYSIPSQNISVRNALGGDLQTLELTGGSISATQDGERIAYDFSGDVWVANIDGSDPVNVSNTIGFTEERPSLSSDGARIVYQRDEGSLLDVFVMNVDGSAITNLTPGTDASNDGEPEWSPDGTRIVFGSDRTGDIGLYTMASDGSDVIKLTDGFSDRTARWSPDGQRIVFARFLDPAAGGTDFELFVINSDVTGLTQITRNGAFRTTDADWFPDGQWMVLATQDLNGLGFYDLYVMRSDGTDRVRLTTNEGGAFPRWLP